MTKRQYRILRGWKYESIGQKLDWFLSLPLDERYNRVVSMGEFLKRIRKGKAYTDVRRAFKTVQILKQK